MIITRPRNIRAAADDDQLAISKVEYYDTPFGVPSLGTT